MIFGRNIQTTLQHMSFHAGSLACQLFVFHTGHRKNANSVAVSSKRPRFDEVHFFLKRIPEFIKANAYRQTDGKSVYGGCDVVL